MRKTELTECVTCHQEIKLHARGMCSKCHGKWYYQNNKDRMNKECRDRYHSDLEKSRERNKNHYKENLEYHVERGKVYREENWNKCRQRHKEWRKTESGKRCHRNSQKVRNARKRTNCSPEQDVNVKLILNTVKNCSYCGSNNNLTLEHIIPVSQGGNNSIDNLTMACNICNSSKHAKDLLIWLGDRKPFDKEVVEKYLRMSKS